MSGVFRGGKSTIAAAVAQRLSEMDVPIELLDGDALRSLLPTGFSAQERDLHVRRTGYLASRLEHHGVTVLCALISPQEESREWVRRHCERFVEIHVSTPLAECERRDVKGLYAAARRGELQGFTGVSAPYCAPKSPDLILNTVDVTLPAAVDRVLSVWAQRAFTETGAEVWMADRSRRGLAS